MKNIILIAVAILILVGGGVYMLMSEDSQLVENESTTPTAPTSATPEAQPEQATTTPEESASDEPTSVLGTSAGGEVITAYHFGTGETELLFIGGIHGGYSWNTSLLAFELIDWLEENEDKVPKNVKGTIIPVLNPDGLKVVTWNSAAGGVYSSSCNNGISTETKDLTNLFAKAAGYTAHEEFDYYQITGDMVNWFAGQNIPAISVLLTNHTDTEFSKNLSGLQAMLTKYAE